MITKGDTQRLPTAGDFAHQFIDFVIRFEEGEPNGIVIVIIFISCSPIFGFVYVGLKDEPSCEAVE